AVLRNGNLEKGLPVIHGPAGVGDQPMRGAVAGMHVGVDETRRDQLSPGVDDPIDAALESLADVNDPVALEDELCIAQERVLASRMTHDPSRLDLRAHAVSPSERPVDAGTSSWTAVYPASWPD